MFWKRDSIPPATPARAPNIFDAVGADGAHLPLPQGLVPPATQPGNPGPAPTIIIYNVAAAGAGAAVTPAASALGCFDVGCTGILLICFGVWFFGPSKPDAAAVDEAAAKDARHPIKQVAGKRR